MARGDCSELSLELTELAMDIGADPAVKNIDDVVARMRQFPELAPRISRQLVEDSIVEATAGHAQELSDLQKKLNRLMNEARLGSKLRGQIRDFRDHAEKGSDPVADLTPKQQQTNAIKELRSELGELNKVARLRAGRTGSAALATELAKAHIEAGITDRGSLVNAVHADMVRMIPEITRREVQDAISGFGKFTRLSTADVDVILRDLKIQLQQESKLADIAAGIAPAKTGRERPIPSAESRRLIQRVNEAKRAGKFKVTDPETQLKTALDGIKTRLNNQIEDLETEIKTREKIVTERTPVERDEEALELEARRDALREQRAEIFGEKGLSDTQRVELAKRATQRTVDELERRVSEGDFSRPGRPIPPSDEALDVLRKRRDRLREQFRKRNPNLPEISRAKLRIEEIERHLQAGTIPPPPQRGAQDNPWLVELRRRQSELQRSLNQSPTAQKTRLMNSIAETTRRLEEQDFAPRVKDAAPVTPEIEKLQFEQRKLRNLLTQKINDKKLSWSQRWTREIFDTPRAMVSTLDISAVGRQGFFIVVSNPHRAAKALVPMFRAMFSEKNQLQIHDEIYGRPNAHLYARYNLFLADIGPETQLSNREEIFRSSLAERIPIYGAAVRGSNRAYATFLNRIRSDMFDAMSATLARNSELTDNEGIVIANYINTASGRGDLIENPFKDPKRKRTESSAFLFSERYMVSRFQIAAFSPIWTQKTQEGGGSAIRARALVTTEYVKALIGLKLMYSLFGMFGWDVEWDARSSDFGKIKMGDRRFDVLAGLGQTVVFAQRLRTGEIKSTTRGKITNLRGDGWKFMDMDDLIINTLLLYKLAPAPSAALNLARGKTLFGDDPRNLTTLEGASGVAGDLLLPLSVKDIVKELREEGIEDVTIVLMLNMLGVGSQKFSGKRGKRGKKKTRSTEAILESSRQLLEN